MRSITTWKANGDIILATRASCLQGEDQAIGCLFSKPRLHQWTRIYKEDTCQLFYVAGAVLTSRLSLWLDFLKYEALKDPIAFCAIEVVIAICELVVVLNYHRVIKQFAYISGLYLFLKIIWSLPTARVVIPTLILRRRRTRQCRCPPYWAVSMMYRPINHPIHPNSTNVHNAWGVPWR